SQCVHPLQSLSLFFTGTSTTEIYTLSLHDALPICNSGSRNGGCDDQNVHFTAAVGRISKPSIPPKLLESSISVPMEKCEFTLYRSEEHTSELQSRENLVCRLLLEKKKKRNH